MQEDLDSLQKLAPYTIVKGALETLEQVRKLFELSKDMSYIDRKIFDKPLQEMTQQTIKT